MYEVDTSTPVLVTGATGYVAGWIVRHLLEAGVTVHAAVRDPSKTAKCQHLDEIALGKLSRRALDDLRRHRMLTAAQQAAHDETK